MSRPGFPGINYPGLSTVSTGNILASGAIGIQNPAMTHSVAVYSPGNSMLRLRDALPVMQVSFASVMPRSFYQHFELKDIFLNLRVIFVVMFF